jgi:hypothetical protein
MDTRSTHVGGGVGERVGGSVGERVGKGVGERVGGSVGERVGKGVGEKVGKDVGEGVRGGVKVAVWGGVGETRRNGRSMEKVLVSAAERGQTASTIITKATTDSAQSLQDVGVRGQTFVDENLARIPAHTGIFVMGGR